MHYIEPFSNFLFLNQNLESEISVTCTSENSYTGGFNKGFQSSDGKTYSGHLIAISRGTVTGFPLIAEAIKLNGSNSDIIGVMHEDKKNSWRMIPLLNGKK